jgi:nodulation protein E
MGCVSALGHTMPEFWDAIVNCRSGIGALELERMEHLLIKIGAQVRGFDATTHFSDTEIQILDPFSQYALVAAREAVAQAGLTRQEVAGPRTAVILGTGIGGSYSQDAAYFEYYREGRKRVRPLTIPRVMPSASVSAVCREFRVTGPSFTTCSACASSNHALGVALWLLRSGSVDRVISGGSEAIMNNGSVNAWQALKVLSPDGCRPFSNDRRGMVLGEGAGIVVLERPDVARARGATVYAEICGFGMSSDAGDIMRPDVGGASASVTMALGDARMAPDAVDYVNAHGTGTLLNDVIETQVIKTAFGDHAARLAISSTKSMHGHLLGGTGAVEIIATILALHHQVAPPTAGYSEPDVECDLDYVPNEARPMRIDCAVSNSFAFGGLNAVIALRRAD